MTVAVLALATASGCGSDKAEPGGARAGTCDVPLGNPRAALAKLRAQSNEILDCGTSAFRRRLDSLKGHPVVVNKWASWCGPCRHEFPFFGRLARRHAREIAFLGVDSEDAKSDAREFLKEFPVPYPSYFDPDSEVAKVFRGERVFPASAFYDRSGELVFTKQGGYASEAALADDIEKYAR